MDKTTRTTASILLIGGGIILFYGFQTLRTQNYQNATLPILLILTGGLCFSIGALFGMEKTPPRLSVFMETLAASLRIRLDQLTMLTIGLIFSVIAQQAAGYNEMMRSPLVAITAWITALILVVMGCWRANEAGKYPSTTNLRARLEIPLTLIGVFILAFLPRIILPEKIPVLLTGDEGSAGRIATLFARGEFNNLFMLGWYSFPSLYFAIPGMFIRFLGPTLTALRLSSAIPGALTVVAVFWVTRSVCGKRTAWFAAIFLATLHFHVHFSRIALNNIWDGLWITGSLGALWYAWNRERRNAYILAGFCLGFIQYFYASGHVLPFIMFIWLTIAGLSDRPRFKRALPDLFLMALTGIVVAMPLILFYIKSPLELVAPIQRVSILYEDWLNITVQSRGLPIWRILLEQVWLGFGAYVYIPLRNWYTPEIPILQPNAAVFFVLGLIFTLVRGHKKFGLLIALWLTAFALQGALSESTPAAQRYPASAPAVAILVGVGLSELSGLFEKLWPSFRKQASAVAIVVILLLAGQELHFYFWKYTFKEYWNAAQSNGMVGYHLGLYLQSRPTDAQIVFLGGGRMGFRSIPSTQYLAPQFEGIDINQPWGSPENPQPEQDHLIFIILPQHKDEIPLIQKDYPDGTLSWDYSTDGSILFYIYEYNPNGLP